MITKRYTKIMIAFGKRLKAARERGGYRSAEKFAQVLGMESPAYRKYERGESPPNLETLTRICQLLRITPNYLLPDAASVGDYDDGIPRPIRPIP
jgi:transcriptional regulator with XRE-family HTH domain